MKINEIIILIIFSIIISSCTAIPKPNPDKPDSILIVPVSVTNKSKHPISQQFQFTFSNKDDGSEVFHTYLPKVDNSYLIIKNLKPGNYQFLRVSNSKNSKIKKELSNSTFKMEDDTITIIQDQFVYEQTVRGGDWYTYNFNTSYLNKGGYNKLIEKLEENENFKSWKIRCKWCNKSDTSSPVMRPVGYTSSNASATSNVFVLKGVTSEFWAGDIVTFGDSKKEYEILETGVLCFSSLTPCPIVLY
ncbi:MAG: cupredoxin domain-containing protein, partial [Alphaproteobacteria bacterium]|nr:cupredoxin domain-containing protein [Alphaproteobacteria bacterium]